MKAVVRKTARVEHRPAPRGNDRRLVTQHPRRQVLSLAAGAAALPAVSRIAGAQNYPTKPITVIVPFPAGGATDAIGRVVTARMTRSLGQPLIIENVPGADGSIGVGRAARARADGYTLSIGLLDTQVLNGAFYSLPFDLLNDFAPIAPLVVAPIVLFARKTLPAQDLNEFIAWLRANPDRASAGVGTLGMRLLTMSFRMNTNTRFALVPYRGAAPALQDLAGGQIDFCFNTPEQLQLVRSGSIKAYAATGDMRLSVAPDIPTFAEAGLPLFFSLWFGLFAPKSTPRQIIVTLNTAVREALAEPEVRGRLADLGYEFFPPEQQSPETLGTMVRAGAEKWWPIIKELGIKPE